jgi:hypothetical protein
MYVCKTKIRRKHIIMQLDGNKVANGKWFLGLNVIKMK